MMAASFVPSWGGWGKCAVVVVAVVVVVEMVVVVLGGLPSQNQRMQN